MPERRRRPDLDERFSLDMEPADALRRLLNTEDAPDEDDAASDADQSD